jgi:hypothetical protein
MVMAYDIDRKQLKVSVHSGLGPCVNPEPSSNQHLSCVSCPICPVPVQKRRSIALTDQDCSSKYTKFNPTCSEV